MYQHHSLQKTHMYQLRRVQPWSAEMSLCRKDLKIVSRAKKVQSSSSKKFSDSAKKKLLHLTIQAPGQRSFLNTVSAKSTLVFLRISSKASTSEYPSLKKLICLATTHPLTYCHMHIQRLQRRSSRLDNTLALFLIARLKISLDLSNHLHCLLSPSQENQESIRLYIISLTHILLRHQPNPSTRQSMQMITPAHMAHSPLSASSFHAYCQAPKFQSVTWPKLIGPSLLN